MPTNPAKTSGNSSISSAGEHDPPRRPRAKFTPDEVAFMRMYAEEGYTATAIAEALGCHVTAVAERLKAEGIDYVRAARGHPSIRAPRIFDRSKPRVSAEKARAIVSSARRNTTLAAVARETGVDERTVERVLQFYAPTVWRWQMRGGIVPPGGVLARVAGDWDSRLPYLVDNGLRQPRDYDNLVVDYGVEEVTRWLERLDADHHALRAVRLKLRNALERMSGRDD